MQGGRSTSHVPWSRHMGVSQTTSRKNDFCVGPDNLSKRKTCLSTEWESVGKTTTTRRASSESDLEKGSHTKVYDDDDWESQSDPGSISSRKSKWLASSVEDAQDKGEIGDRKSWEHTRRRPPVQGRGSPPNELGRRAGRNGNTGIGENGGDFVVEMVEHVLTDAFDSSKTHIPQYVHSYFDFLYYSCVSPYKWDKIDNIEQTKCQNILSMVQKVIFVYIALLATFSSFHLVKYFVLSFIIQRDMNNFIDIGYFIVSGLFQLYLTYFVIFSRECISKKLQIWKQYELTTKHKKNSNATAKCREWLPIVNGLATIAVVLLKTMALHSSFNEATLAYSKETAEALFLWTPEQMMNRTSIHNSFGENPSVTTYTTGIIGFLSVFFWNLQMDCMKDLIYWVAKANKRHVLELGKKLEENLSTKAATGKSSEEKDDQCWATYRQMMAVNASTNLTYSTLFLFSHLDTFLTFSYFLTQVLNEDATIIDVMIIGYDVLKGILPFFPARRASLQNDQCRKWIQTLPCQTQRFTVGDTAYTREVMLWELKEDCLGLGSGKMHVNNEFIVTFITLVASLFCFLLNLTPKRKAVIRY